MNKTILNFLDKQDLNLEKLENLDGFSVRSDSDVNWILSNHRVYKRYSTTQDISIADIEGYDYMYIELGRMSLFENMSYFFDENGSSYAKRSISMLNIPTDEILAQLSSSFSREPICLIESDKGRYTISSNGLHRYHILKAHYLKELASINSDDQEAIDSLKEKYTFKTTVSETDYFKSYSRYILETISGKEITIRAELDENYQATGKSIVIDEKANRKLVLNDSQLSSYLKKSVVDFMVDKKTPKKEIKSLLDKIENAYENFESFREFYDQNLLEVIPSSYISNLKTTYSDKEEIECE